VPLPSITPFFSNKGYHPNLTVHQECDLASACARDFVTDLNELHNNFNSTSLKLNIDTKFPLIPDGFPPRNSKSVAKHMSRLNSSIPHNPPRNSQRNSLDRTKSLHDPAPIPSCYDFWTVSVLYTRYSTFPCWNQRFRIRSLIAFNPTPAITVDNEPKFKISEILDSKLTTAVVPANYCILSIGQGMRVLTKKLLGYLLPNLDMLPNSLRISTLHTQPNLALYQVFPNPDLQPSSSLHFLRITLFFMFKIFWNYYLL